MASSADNSMMTQKTTATLYRPSEVLSGLMMEPVRHHPAPPSIDQALSLVRT